MKKNADTCSKPSGQLTFVEISDPVLYEIGAKRVQQILRMLLTAKAHGIRPVSAAAILQTFLQNTLPSPVRQWCSVLANNTEVGYKGTEQYMDHDQSI